MMRLATRLRIIVASSLLLIVPILAADRLVSDAHWRLAVIAMKATGKLPAIPWGDLADMLRPGSGFWLEPLLVTPNPYAVIRNPHTSAQDVRTGKALFRWRCASCHGAAARGALAPSLAGRDLTHGSSDWALYRTIRDGVSGTSMAPHAYPGSEIWKLVAYIEELGTDDAAANPQDAPQRTLAATRVSYASLRASRTAGTEWPTYYGSYDGYRFSSLASIDRRNVGQLQARWIYQLRSKGNRLEATPIAAGGRLFITDPYGGVLALNAATGERLWRFSRPVTDKVSLCCVTANRGVALLDGSVFVATLDAHVIALDSATGKVLWDRQIADPRSGYSSTGAPIAIDGKVITGIAGSEFGARGFIVALDAGSGQTLWRFDTIPRPGEKGNETWAGDSWRQGGAATWMAGTYDPELGLIYWGTANPSPDYDGSQRVGDNLYSNSVLALHADTGQLAWYFQYTPHDNHDWDSVQVPVLADVQDGSKTRRLLLTANRNGFFYVLDRTDGKLVRAAPFATQTWAERIDPAGRPVTRADASPSERGTLVYPGATGATNWWPPTYDPIERLFVIPALERPGVFFKTTRGEQRWTDSRLGGYAGSTSASHYTAIRAIDPLTGARRWEHRSDLRHDDADLCGLLSTAGGIVFTNDRSRLIALDIADGRELWSFEAGAKIYSPPSTYLAGREQIVAFAAGDAVIGLALPPPLPVLSASTTQAMPP